MFFLGAFNAISLTLTLVVFEFFYNICCQKNTTSLTLTLVVFEFPLTEDRIEVIKV